MSGSKNRDKGHNLEREVARWFRDKLGFKFAKTTREASRLLDSCKIDIANVPLLIQCKAGYSRNYPKYPVIYKNIKQLLKRNFKKESELHDLPIVLIHKIDARKQGEYYWSFSDEFAKKLLEVYFKNKENVQSEGTN